MKQLTTILFVILLLVAKLDCKAINNTDLFSKQTTSLTVYSILPNNLAIINTVLLYNDNNLLMNNYVLIGIMLLLIAFLIYSKISSTRLFIYQNKLRYAQEKELREAVDKLTKSEQLLNEAQKIAKIAYLERNVITGETIYSNNLWNLFEISIEEKDKYEKFLMNLEFIHQDDRERYYETVEKIKEKQLINYTISYKAITVKGNIINLNSTGTRILNSKGELEKLLIILQDITENKKIVDEIQVYERKFIDVFNHSPLMITISTLEEGVFLDVNEHFLNVFEYKKEEVIGKSVKSLNLYYDLNDRENIVALLKEKGFYKNYEAKFYVPDGSIRDGIFNGSIIDLNGQKMYLSILTDVTNLKSTVSALSENEERYKMIVENTNDGIFIYNNGKLVFTNSKIRDSLGYTEEEIMNLNIFDLVHPDDRRYFKTAMKRRDDDLLNTTNFELRVLTKNNLIRICEFMKKTIPINGGSAMLGIVHDITDIRTAELELRIFNRYLEEKVNTELKRRELHDQALLQKSKLEFIGEMAAGMAHEINQPLTGITMGLDNILNKVSSTGVEEGYLLEKLKTLFGYVTRIENIIEHVRTFSRDQQITIHEIFSINETIDNALILVTKTYKINGIEINFESKEELFSKGNKYKFEQVMLNLLSNAKDAIVEKEKVHKEIIYNKTIDIKLFAENDLIYIYVKDNGIGISKRNLDNIFKPFYTTKDADKGTGLGLSIAYGIIKEMNGEIDTESVEDEYTSMMISLPKINA